VLRVLRQAKTLASILCGRMPAAGIALFLGYRTRGYFAEVLRAVHGRLPSNNDA